MEPRPSRLLGKALFQLSCVPKHVESVYMAKLAGLLSRLWSSFLGLFSLLPSSLIIPDVTVRGQDCSMPFLWLEGVKVDTVGQNSMRLLSCHVLNVSKIQQTTFSSHFYNDKCSTHRVPKTFISNIFYIIDWENREESLHIHILRTYVLYVCMGKHICTLGNTQTHEGKT